MLINDNLCFQLHGTQVLGVGIMKIRAYSIYDKITTKRIYFMIFNLKSEHYWIWSWMNVLNFFPQKYECLIILLVKTDDLIFYMV